MIADDRSPTITASTRASLTTTTASPYAGDDDRNETDHDGRQPPQRDVGHDDATQPHQDATAGAQATVSKVDRKLLLLQLIECLNKLAKTSAVEPDCAADDVDEVAQSSEATSEHSESLEPADDDDDLTAGDESPKRARRESKRRLPAVVDVDDDEEAETEADRAGCRKRRCTGGGYSDRRNPRMTSPKRNSHRSSGRRAMRWDERSEVYTISSGSSDDDRDYVPRRHRKRKHRVKDAQKDLTFLLKAFGWPLSGIDLDVFRSAMRNFVSVYESNKHIFPADERTMTSYEKRVVRIVKRLLPEVTSHEAASVLVLLYKPATDHHPPHPPTLVNVESTDGESTSTVTSRPPTNGSTAPAVSAARPRSADGGEAYGQGHCAPGTGSAPPPPQQPTNAVNRTGRPPTAWLPQQPPVVVSRPSKPVIPSLFDDIVEPPWAMRETRRAPLLHNCAPFSGAPHRPVGGLLPSPCDGQLNETVLRSAFVQSMIRGQSLPNKRPGVHSD